MNEYGRIQRQMLSAQMMLFLYHILMGPVIQATVLSLCVCVCVCVCMYVTLMLTNDITYIRPIIPVVVIVDVNTRHPLSRSSSMLEDRRKTP